jgi:PAS domain S-box-containing protein
LKEQAVSYQDKIDLLTEQLEEVIQELIRSQRYLEAIFNLSSDCFGLADNRGFLRQVSPGCVAIYGYQPEEMLGRHFQEFYADTEKLFPMLEELRENNKVVGWEIDALGQNGRVIPVVISIHRIFDESSHLLGSLALIRDQRSQHDLLTHLRQKEIDLHKLNSELERANLELAQANKLKSEFLANTSHELRTPLNSILGFLRLVLDGLCDNKEEERDFLQNAYVSTRHLLDLINDILDIAKIEAGKMELDLREVNIAELFEEIRKLTHVQAEQKHLQLTFNPPGEYVAVRADEGKLKQVLLNLVANAIKFTGEGEIQVKSQPLIAKGHVIFEIIDSGIGIPPDKQDALFQKFAQVDGSSTRGFGGTGLGLAISKNLVQLMGGQIWLTSKGENQGTIISFTLPIMLKRQPFFWRRAEDRERGLVVKGEGTGPLILLVDDEPTIINMMERILHKEGYRTIFAVTADDGLDGARRLRPDLLTIDMALPSRPQALLHSGLELFLALQEDAATAHIPAIMITGHEVVLDKLKDRGLELPVVLKKPFRARQLVDKMVECLTKTGKG